MNPRALLAEVRKRPLLIIGGLVGLFAIANLGDLFDRGGGTVEPEVVPEDPTAVPSTDTMGADSAGFTTPSYGYGVPSYDPFSTDLGTTQPTVQYTADGCPLPRPETPAAYAGKGEYACDPATKGWVFKWAAAKVSKGGCLLPRPAVPPQYTGKGEWECDSSTKQWVWKWKATAPVPPAAKPGKLVLGAGKHQTFKVDGKKGSDPRSWQHGAVTVQTGPKVSVTLGTGAKVDLVKIRSGGQAGRWIRPSAGTWTAPTGG